MILLSTANSVLSFAHGYTGENFQYYAPLVAGVMSTCVALIGTFRSFSKSEQLLSGHHTSAQQYALLCRHINSELCVCPKDRRISGVEMIRGCSDDMDRLYENAPVILDERKRIFLRTLRKDAEQRKVDEQALGIKLPDLLYSMPASGPHPHCEEEEEGVCDEGTEVDCNV